MSLCCDIPETRPGSSATATLTVALAGNPNCGKTTIFNALTGLRQKVANYPGVTVEKKTGRFKLPDGRWTNVIDLPGTYSLVSRSPDERVAMEVLRGLRKDTPAPDVVVVVVDASNLQRNLYLVSQLIEMGRPLVVALNMMDVAERRGIHVSPEALAKQLGVPVVSIVGHKKRGVTELKQAIANAKVAPMPNWPLPEAMKEELLVVGGGLAILDSQDAPPIESPGLQAGASAEAAQVGLGDVVAPRAWICRAEPNDRRRLDRYQAIAERLLIGDHAPDVLPLMTRQPIASLLQSSTSRLASLGIDPMQADIEAHYRWIEGVANGAIARVEELAAEGTPAPDDVLPYASPQARTFSDTLDSILIHKVWGLAIFSLIMTGLFVTIFWVADPLMGMMEEVVGWLGSFVAPFLPEGPIQDLWTDGIVAGVGGVVVFVPQIALLFLFLAIMEDSGYLARAAFLMDRVLGKVGLHGKSFIPLLSSFACAIPGIMATRTIEDRKDRLATIFVAPFMSCSARLPVYFLLIGTFFASYSAWVQGSIMAACYLLGIAAAGVTAWVFKRSMLKGTRPAFILEMPTYKLPQLEQVVRTVWTNTWAFLAKAGTIIFVLSVILWAMTYYPRLPEERADAIAQDLQRANGIEEWLARQPADFQDGAWQNAPDAIARIEQRAEEDAEKVVASEQLRYSIAGRFGRVLEPVIRPLGYDWKMGVGLIGAFGAREVFVSFMGIVYSAGDEEHVDEIAAAMQADTYPDGRPVWTPVVALSLLAWFVLAMQCMSTMAIVKRETGGWRWPLLMLLYMNGLAYLVALVIFQVGSRFVG